MKPNTGFTGKALAFCMLIGLALGWFGNSYFADQPATATSYEPTAEQADLGLFWDVWNTLENNYFDTEDIDQQLQIYGAISGLVDSLGDAYSVFMTPDETESFQTSLAGELEGIGAELTVRDGQLVIVTPLKDTPAEEAGLLPGDHIFMVNDEPTSEMTIWDAIMKIRGEPNTDVVLTIIRDGLDTALDITITRQQIHIPSVELTIEEHAGDQIAHLSIYQFGDDTYSEFNSALRELLLANVDGIVLDLRMNGGGYLDVSVEILGEFFEDQVKAVIVKYRNDINEVMYTDGKGSLSDIPVVVLIDEGSASASEIVAGALQDHARATLMGEQSFGKGSVQELNALIDGSSLRLTIAKWFTPDDRTIHDVGITPDHIIEMETTEVDTENDI